MVYADFDFYSNVYHGSMSAEEFGRLAAKASLQIDRITQNRAASAPASMARALSLCCCELADRLLAWDAQDQATQGGLVTGENVDGYSVSYQAQGAPDERGNARKRELRSICRDYLSYPINLMYTGASVV